MEQNWNALLTSYFSTENRYYSPSISCFPVNSARNSIRKFAEANNDNFPFGDDVSGGGDTEAW